MHKKIKKKNIFVKYSCYIRTILPYLIAIYYVISISSTLISDEKNITNINIIEYNRK